MRFLVLLTVLLMGCQTPGGSERPPGPPVELASVPFFAQDTDQCGPAALATVLNHAGVPTKLSAARSAVYLPGRGGAVKPEMTAAIRREGLVALSVEPDFKTLYQELQAGRPVLVFQNLGFRPFPIWHYAVLVGYDPSTDEVLLRSGMHARHVMPRSRFLKTWTRGERWALAVLRPGEIPAWAAPDDYLLAIAALEQIGQVDAALHSYRAATVRWPDESAGWLGLGNVNYARRDLKAAARAYRHALTVDHTDIVALNNLAHTLGESGCPAMGLALVEGAPPSALLDETRAELERMRSTAERCSDHDPQAGRNG